MSAPRGLRWTGPGATFVLVLLCLVIAGGVGLASWWGDRPGSSRPTPQTPITAAVERDSALEAAGPLAERVLSYSWDDFDEVTEETLGLLGSGFAEEYAAQMRDVRREVVRERVTVRSTAREVGVVSAGPGRAVALLFVDQVSTSQGAAGERREEARVLVTLTADAGEWRVTRLDAF